ncbi:MAG: LolA family protein [Actinomycetota bacterium]
MLPTHQVNRLAAAALAFSLFGAAPAFAEDARQILLNSLDPKVATYQGEQVTEVRPAPARVKPRRTQPGQRVYRKGRTLRIEYPDGRIFFDDGDQQLLYLSRQSLVEQGPSSFNPKKLAQQRQAIARGRVIVTARPDDTVAGRPAYVVEARQAKNQRTIWIDKQTYVQLRQDVQQPSGRVVSTYFRSIEFKDPPAEKLSYSPPPNAPVVERGRGRPVPAAEAEELAKSWGGLLMPKSVPPGYVFRGYYHHRFREHPLLVAVYRGPRERQTLSMFQGPATGMGSMAKRQRGNLRVVAGRKGQADVLLVAPLPEEELQRIMGSVSPQ